MDSIFDRFLREGILIFGGVSVALKISCEITVRKLPNPGDHYGSLDGIYMKSLGTFFSLQ